MSPGDDACWPVKLRRFWFEDLSSLAWLLLGLPALYFFQTVMHEGMHWLVAVSDSSADPTFIPYPHTKDGTFFNGRVRGGVGGDSWLIGLPQISALITMTGLTAICIWWPIANRVARFVLRTWLLVVSIDLLWNTIGGVAQWASTPAGETVGRDWARFGRNAGAGWMWALAVFFWLLFLSHLLWVHYSAWTQDPPRKSIFWTFRWVSGTFGVLSLTAFIMALAITSDDFEKWDQAIFIVYTIAQLFLSLICLLFFAVGMKLVHSKS